MTSIKRHALFDTILIANRGEIAVRVIRACRELGVRSVAVYSEADAGALHARMADRAVLIGPPAPADSYLRVDRLLEAAAETGAQAVHPGYGFLAENAGFARAVTDAGLAFIGPPVEAIRVMGDKKEARAMMQAAGVPVVPGSHDADDIPTLMEEAARIRYPVMVKAVAGGGGKGMRVVWDAGDLPEELAAARREAEGAFGDGRLLLEKYVPYARHVEFQILGDSHGNLVHLFERECSVQRRHQKIIEETPSPLLDAALREAMGAAALAAARAVGYENAGTVEFIVDPASRAFYFLEMNTRLQVEHPITEAVTGLDLVAWQLRIAAGERLPFRQADLAQRGHALECRLYAEDPAQGFLPASGRLLRFVEPRGPAVRVDAGFASGDSVGTHYDSLLAKVIVHAESREAAIRRMQAALAEAVLLGLTTNREFLLDALAHPEFQAGQATTHFVERHFPAWEPDGQEVPAAALIAAALGELGASGGEAPATAGPDPYSPWDLLRGFRLGGDGS